MAPMGELAEGYDWIFLALPTAPVIPQPCERKFGRSGKIGVWKIVDDELQFYPNTQLELPI